MDTLLIVLGLCWNLFISVVLVYTVVRLYMLPFQIAGTVIRKLSK